MAGKTRSGTPDGRKQWIAPGRHAGRWFQASWRCAAVAGAPRAAASAGELRFGLTPVFLTSDLELLDRLRSYLEQATGFPVRLVTRRTYQEITSLLLSGQLDAAWICGFPFVANRRGCRSLRCRSGRASPSTVPISSPARDRQATALDDLQGRRPRLLGSGQQLRLAGNGHGARQGRARPRSGSSAERSSPTGTGTSSAPSPPGWR